MTNLNQPITQPTTEKKKSGDKIKILYHSDSSLVKTGFGRNAKALLSYLYKTGKYEIVHLCCSSLMGDDKLKATPWKSIGAVTNDQRELLKLNKNPEKARMAGYGSGTVDKVIKDEKPDIYIGVQDIWGIDYSIKKEWFRKIPSILWTTLDSLPILPTALKASKNSKNFWVWSNFAEKEMKRLGHDNVQTLHGCFDTTKFFKIDESDKLKLRKTFLIEEDAFVIGFVFRNQLRKSVPNLIEGYSKFRKEKKDEKKSYLLLHTNFSEGWDIPSLSKEYGVPLEEILTTYICKKCDNFLVNPFKGQSLTCPYCKSEKSLSTTGVSKGVTEHDLNLVYNLMDVYCHPFTSGGQEMPIQEAKLAELITLVTNYSCGEEMCAPEANSLALEWFEYREHGTQFRKASTDPNSINLQLQKVYNMSSEERLNMGKLSRQWAIDNFSVEKIGGKLEEFLDSVEKTNYDFDFDRDRNPNPKALIPICETDSEWVIALYKYILDREVDPSYDGHQYWMAQLEANQGKKEIENYFRQTAIKDAQEARKGKKLDFESLLDEDDKGRRIAFVLPESSQEIFLSTAILPSIKKIYPDYNIYYCCKPEYFDILEGNEYVHKTVPYIEDMNPRSLEGSYQHKGFFEIAFFPGDSLLKTLNYTHNDKDIIELELCTS